MPLSPLSLSPFFLPLRPLLPLRLLDSVESFHLRGVRASARGREQCRGHRVHRQGRSARVEAVGPAHLLLPPQPLPGLPQSLHQLLVRTRSLLSSVRCRTRAPAALCLVLRLLPRAACAAHCARAQASRHHPPRQHPHRVAKGAPPLPSPFSKILRMRANRVCLCGLPSASLGVISGVHAPSLTLPPFVPLVPGAWQELMRLWSLTASLRSVVGLFMCDQHTHTHKL